MLAHGYMTPELPAGEIAVCGFGATIGGPWATGVIENNARPGASTPTRRAERLVPAR